MTTSRRLTHEQRTAYALHRDEIAALVPASTMEEISHWYHHKEYYDQLVAALVAWSLFDATKEINPSKSLEFGDIYLNLKSDPDLPKAREIAAVHRQCGNIRKFIAIFEQHLAHRADYKYLKISKAELEMLDHGFPIETKRPTPKYPANPDSSFYLLHNSLPHQSGGYATRSHGLLTALKSLGQDCIGVSRLGFPLDEKNPPPAPAAIDTIDGLSYHRLLENDHGYRDESIVEYLTRYASAVETLALKYRPSIIHGASNYMNGIVANTVAARLGLRSIYEVRGLWEITRSSRQPEWKNSELYQMFVKMETQAAASADAVITITRALKSELVNRGIPQEKILVIPNGVDTSRFIPRQPDYELKSSLGLNDKLVIGFVGSVVDYEGLHDLLAAASILKQKYGDRFALLIVGDGAARKELIKQAADLSLDQQVIFTGRVPHSEVERYYSIIDIAPFPRIPIWVCEMVSPLKPFEAMAMGKAVVASSVDALAEIVADGENGLIFEKGSVSSLAAVLDTLLSNEILRKNIGATGRTWVVQNRDWKILSAKIKALYQSLLVKSATELP